MFFKLINFYKLQNRSIKKSLFCLIAITFLIGFVEMVGVGIIFPFLDFVINNNIPSSIILPFDKFSTESKNFILLSSSIFLICFFGLKNIFLTFMVFLQYRMVGKIRMEISSKLFQKYLYSDYVYFVNNNSNEISKNLITMTSLFNSNILIPTGIFLSELFIIILLTILLFSLNFFGSLLLFSSITIAVFVYHKIVKNRLVEFGKVFQDSEALRIKSINEMIGSIKDIKITDSEDYFFLKYKSHDAELTKSFLKASVINSLTKYFLEFILIFSIFVFIFFEIYFRHESINDLFPFLALYAVSAFKLIPSLNRVINSMQQFKFAEKILDKFTKELENFIPIPKKHSSKNFATFKDSLFLENINFGYDGQPSIFKNLNLKINKGEVIGFFGKSGTGKTTLINLLLGFLKPTGGKFVINNESLEVNRSNYKNLFGYVPQDIYLLDDSILNNVSFGVDPDLINRNDVLSALKKAGLLEFVESLQFGLDSNVGERGLKLSGGQKQRLGIARALYFGAKILIFDEATSSLDIETEKTVLSNISKLKKDYTIILITHRISTLYFCDSVYELRDRNLVKRNLKEGKNYKFE